MQRYYFFSKSKPFKESFFSFIEYFSTLAGAVSFCKDILVHKNGHPIREI